ncbi:MAG: D-alanine--D-alanine ligase [Deltaproteobacteria bacterium]|nr:D-alanine--D-alanine ligase [Deltaproteobacteria bacterium]
MTAKKVGVLMGGLSAEREVSLRSGKAVLGAVARLGYEAVGIDAGRDLDVKLRESRVEAVVIALHGRLGEDGTVQGLLEVMGIPYSGSPVLASALAMDKVLTRQVLVGCGLPMAEGFALGRDDAARLPPGWAPPVVVKPATEGSSVGVTIVKNPAAFEAAVVTALKCSDRAVVERFVAGTEVNVAVLDGKALGAVEIEPHREFYDYEAKYAPGGSSHHIPPRIPKARIDEALELGQAAYTAVGCAGAARVDLIVPREGRTVILEVNTIPGMTETSLLPEIAASAGMSFDALVKRMIDGATLHGQPSGCSSR